MVCQKENSISFGFRIQKLLIFDFLFTGNGYRSIISIIESCLIKIQELSRHIQRSREKIFFRSYHVYMELESYSQVLTRLLTISHLAIVLLDYSDVGNLYPHDCVVDDMMIDFEKINRECFYGRSFGFQVCFFYFCFCFSLNDTCHLSIVLSVC